MNTKVSSAIKETVVRYYSDRLSVHGATHLGVDWNSVESQELRFSKLLQVCPELREFSLIDYGCGFGALFEYLLDKASDFSYLGFDWSEDMVAAGRSLYGNHPNCKFLAGSELSESADYTVASGLFNVKLDQDEKSWHAYILQTLRDIDQVSKKGFAFNALTSYSQEERKVSKLFYADPCELFDFCKRNFSRKVALFHDYDLYEFTIVVRKENV